MSQNGKGDIQRPTDKKKFDDNYERIFGRRGMMVDPPLVDPPSEGGNPCCEIDLGEPQPCVIITPPEDENLLAVIDKLTPPPVDSQALFDKLTSALGIPSGFLRDKPEIKPSED